ncbi:MAG: FMN-binding negative transcriptional regulator [Rhodospirillaceae bacterium]|nr:FMN-binding negative transcriptional regulator [Rhodospirillaceae bacterium]
MHPNPVFRQVSREANLAFATERSFGVLAVDAGDAAGPLLSHIPFLLAGDGRVVHAHIVRSNPIARCLAKGERPAVLAVSGPDGYVSPDWYEAGADLVPTWNYVAVHLRGRLRLRPEETLRPHLDALAAQFEHRLLPKPPWRTSKVPDRHLQAMMRAILPVELDVESVDGTWKLNQNRTDEARLNAARHLEKDGDGMETGRLAGLMRSPPQSG